jgi:hypothetical protein
MSPHYQLMGSPVLWCTVAGDRVLMGAPARNAHSIAGGPAASFTAPCFSAWLRASLRDLSPPMRRCCFRPGPSLNQ